MALPWPLTFSSGERPRALWALLLPDANGLHNKITFTYRLHQNGQFTKCFQENVELLKNSNLKR